MKPRHRSDSWLEAALTPHILEAELPVTSCTYLTLALAFFRTAVEKAMCLVLIACACVPLHYLM